MFYNVSSSSKAKLYLGLKLNMDQVCFRPLANVRSIPLPPFEFEENSQEVFEERSQEVIVNFQERYSSAPASFKTRIEEYQA